MEQIEVAGYTMAINGAYPEFNGLQLLSIDIPVDAGFATASVYYSLNGHSSLDGLTLNLEPPQFEDLPFEPDSPEAEYLQAQAQSLANSARNTRWLMTIPVFEAV